MPELLVSGAQLSILFTLALAAGLGRGFSGFGSALIFVPLASMAVGPQLAVPLLLMIDGVMSLGMLPGAYRLSDKRNVAIMSAGALLGIPAGVLILVVLDPVLLRWGIVVTVLAMLGMLLSGWRYHSRPRDGITAAVGLTAGFLAGAAQIGGPPLLLYWLGGTTPAIIVRASLILFLAVSTAVTAIGYIGAGLLTWPIMLLAAIIAPAFGLGLWAGTRIFHLASEQTFRNICFGMIALSAMTSIPIFDGFIN